MKLNIEKELAALRRLSVGELREGYGEVFGEATRSYHRDFLIRKIIWRLQANEEGDLTERARKRALEIANDADIRLRPPTRLRLVGTDDGPVVIRTLKPPSDQRLPMPGSLLTREYRGRHIFVRVLDRGFEYEGEHYRSLSAIAKVVTGAHWNGWLFFGIKPPAQNRGGARNQSGPSPYVAPSIPARHLCANSSSAAMRPSGTTARPSSRTTGTWAGFVCPSATTMKDTAAERPIDQRSSDFSLTWRLASSTASWRTSTSARVVRCAIF